MADEPPVACSLGPSELEQRLAKIAQLGADSLTSHDIKGGRQVLRFRADKQTRRRLEEVIVAEAQCCTFLEMTLSAENDALILAIAAPGEGGEAAAALAKAFTATT